jgi:hypothetical protein
VSDLTQRAILFARDSRFFSALNEREFAQSLRVHR